MNIVNSRYRWSKQFSTLNTVQQFYTMFCDRSWVIRSNLNRMPSNWSVFVREHLFFSNQKDAFFFVPQKISTNSFFQRQRIIKNQIGDRYTHLHTHKYDRETKTHHRWVIHFIFIFQSKFSYFVIPTIQSWYLVCMQKNILFVHLFIYYKKQKSNNLKIATLMTVCIEREIPRAMKDRFKNKCIHW